MKYLLFSFLIFSGFRSCSQRGQMINGGFEQLNSQGKAVGWKYLSPEEQKTYSVELDSLVKVEGKRSISITKTSNEIPFGSVNHKISQTFEGSEIQLTGYLKTQDVSSSAGFWMRIDGTEGTIAFENMQKQNLKGTNDWKEYTITLPYDSQKARTITFGTLLAGTGKIWIDDLRIFIDGKPIEQAKVKTIVLSKVDADTAFAKRSGIDTIMLKKQQVANLAMLCEVWGFLKYHHPNVAKGKFNFDAELFRVMPFVVKASTNAELSKALEVWVDKLGKPELQVCKSCNIETGGNTAYKPDYGDIFNPAILSQSLVEKLLYILNNHNSGDQYYIKMAPNIGNPIFQNEKGYPWMAYPDEGYRLLCLFRYWNMVQYFFPAKHLIGRDWNQVLKEFISRFVLAANQKDYTLTALAMISDIHDTHANIGSYNQALENYRGTNAFPFQAKFIENKLTVTGYYLDEPELKQKVKIGDVIQRIDGESIDQLIKKYLPITAASNYTTQLRDMPKNYLLRTNKQSVLIEISREGKTQTITMETTELQKLNKLIDYDPDPKAPACKLMEGQIGYLFPGKYKNKDLPEIEKLFINTKGIVVDMRCYPSDFMPFTFVPFIKTVDSWFVRLTNGSLEQPGLFRTTSPLGTPGRNVYRGKVVVIVNELTQSQAEYTTMAFQSSPNVTVIGSTTAGADGDVSSIILPGNISTMISGIGVLYPDGTETQRKGVKINCIVHPTLNGIKAGRDELLEKAVAIINTN